MAATGPIVGISADLARGIDLAFANQGGGRAQEMKEILSRAAEIQEITATTSIFDQEILQLNNDGSTANLTGAGLAFEGDAAAIVGYMRIGSADTSLLEFKSATGFELTVDMNGDAILAMDSNLSVTGVSTINQDVSTTANPTFANLTITSFAANWTNAGRTIADLGIVTTADINGGTIDGVSIGASVAAAAVVSTLSIEADSLILDSDDAGGFTTTLTQSATAARVLTLPDATGTLATLADVQGADELSEILANGNTTGANDIIITSTQVVKAALGGGQLNLSDGGADVITLTTDNGAQAESGIFMDTVEAAIFGSGFSRALDIASSGDIDLFNNVAGKRINIFVSSSAGEIVIGDNAAGAVESAASDTKAVIIAANAGLINAGVTNTVILAGVNITAKTDDTAYVPKIGFFESGVIEGILQKATLTVSSKTWTLPDATGTIALTANTLEDFASTTSAQLAGVISDETGSGVLVFGTNPTLTGVTTTAVADIGGTFLTSGTTTSSGAGAVAITGTIHEITTTGTGDALTLANGAEGQIIQAVYVAEGAGGDTAVLTPTALGGADSTITFNDLGDSVTLLFTAGAWYVRGSKDVVIA